jgi:hypothetical protein
MHLVNNTYHHLLINHLFIYLFAIPTNLSFSPSSMAGNKINDLREGQATDVAP